jgi:hypothetical protein
MKKMKGGVLSVGTIQLLRDQYNGEYNGRDGRPDLRPNLMDIDEFVNSSGIREPIREVVEYVTRDIFRRLLKPVVIPENNADEYRNRYDKLVYEMSH